MAVGFSRYVDGTNSSGSAVAIVDLSACSVGDLVFVFVSRSAVVAVSSYPSGWSSSNLIQNHASTYGVWLFAKVLASGENVSTTFTWAASTKCLAHALVYQGASVVSSAKGTFATGSGTSVDCGTITTNNVWLAQFCSGYSTSAKTYDTLSGYAVRRDRGGTNPDHWHDLCDTNGAWGGGACAPDFIFGSSLSCTYRGGMIVELQANEAVANLVTSAATVYQASAAGAAGAASAELATSAPTVNQAGGTYDYISIERKTGSGGTYAEVRVSNWVDASWLDTYAFSSGTTYYYRAKRTTAAGTSSYSNEEDVAYVAEELAYANYVSSAPVVYEASAAGAAGAATANLVTSAPAIYDPTATAAYNATANLVTSAPTVYQASAAGAAGAASANLATSSTTVYQAAGSEGAAAASANFVEWNAGPYLAAATAAYGASANLVTSSPTVYEPSGAQAPEATANFVSRSATPYLATASAPEDVAFSRYVDGTASAASITASLDLSACSVGDLALVHIARSNSSAVTGTPYGWTLLQAHTTTSYASVYAKRLDAGDIGIVIWTFADSAKVRVLAAVYTGADVKSSAKGTWAPGTPGTTVDCGSITTSSTWVVALCSCYWTAEVTYNTLAGYTERRSQPAGDVDSDRWMMARDTAGSWGGGDCAPDFTLSLTNTASRRAGFLVELEPAGPSPAFAYGELVSSQPLPYGADGSGLRIRTNYLQNPSFEGIQSWAQSYGGNGVADFDLTTDSLYGTYAEEMWCSEVYDGLMSMFKYSWPSTPFGSAAKGDWWYFGVAMKYGPMGPSGGNVFIGIAEYDASNMNLTVHQVLIEGISDTYQVFGIYVMLTEDATSCVRARLKIEDIGVGETSDIIIDGALLEKEGGSEPTYFDGDTPDDSIWTYVWTGDPHESYSIASTGALPSYALLCQSYLVVHLATTQAQIAVEANFVSRTPTVPESIGGVDFAEEAFADFVSRTPTVYSATHPTSGWDVTINADSTLTMNDWQQSIDAFLAGSTSDVYWASGPTAGSASAYFVSRSPVIYGAAGDATGASAEANFIWRVPGAYNGAASAAYSAVASYHLAVRGATAYNPGVSIGPMSASANLVSRTPGVWESAGNASPGAAAAERIYSVPTVYKASGPSAWQATANFISRAPAVYSASRYKGPKRVKTSTPRGRPGMAKERGLRVTPRETRQLRRRS